MVEVIVVIVFVVALVVALQPAHRRTWRPGLDVRNDRDRARLADELALLECFDQPLQAPPPARVEPAHVEVACVEVVRFDGERQEPSPSKVAHPRRFINSRSDKNRNSVAAALAATRTTSSTQRPAVGA